MPEFQCRKCGRKVTADYEACCSHPHACKGEKPPMCCGEPMMEIIDD